MSQYGKVIHADANRGPVAHRDDCGALVCGDIVGDLKVPKGPVNNTKYKYAAVFVSAFGKYIHVYPLQRKSGFLAAFRHFQIVYSDAGHPTKRSMADTGSVMTSAAFRDNALDTQVSLRYSSPHCHWQNGLVERAIYTLNNKTIYNLQQSGLDATPAASNPTGASPRNVWRGRLVRDSDTGRYTVDDPCDEPFRRAYGCDAHVRRDNRTSLQPRSDHSIFLGYAPDHADGCYDFYNMRTGRQCVSRDVIFDERGVTSAECHDYIADEGARTLPEWADFNPFQVSGKATGPNVVSDPASDAPVSVHEGGVSVPNSTPGDNTDVMRIGRPHDMPVALSKTQAKNKYVKHPGIVRRTDKCPRKLY